MKITKKLVQKVLKTVDAGLSNGLGTPEPGKMCVEAAVCYALGLPHGDEPQCVSQAAYAARAGIYDKVLSDFAESVVQVLIAMKVPAVKYLPLTE